MDTEDIAIRNASDEVDPSWAIAVALFSVARALRDLGNGNAVTHMGAIEAFSAHLGEKLDRIAEAIDSS
jgi:hypothetical protein